VIGAPVGVDDQMTADDLEAYLSGLGMLVERENDVNGNEYSVVRDYRILHGGLAGRTCDVAIQRVSTTPYVLPAAIHTRPVLVAMDGAEPLSTLASPLGPDWQYWSRRLDRPPTPQVIWTHIVTVLNDDRWKPA
jgi:hypothetical protein